VLETAWYSGCFIKRDNWKGTSLILMPLSMCNACQCPQLLLLKVRPDYSGLGSCSCCDSCAPINVDGFKSSSSRAGSTAAVGLRYSLQCSRTVYIRHPDSAAWERARARARARARVRASAQVLSFTSCKVLARMLRSGWRHAVRQREREREREREI
jgi:hypothetical protein